MSEIHSIEDILRAVGFDTLGEKPSADAINAVLHRLADSANDVDAVTRVVMRGAAVKALTNLGIQAPAKMIDAVFKTRDETDAQHAGSVQTLSDPEPWPEPVDGARLLAELVTTYTRFVALPSGGATVLALWTLHSHAHDAALVSPTLGVTSPVKRCGKTTLLQLLFGLTPRPLLTSNITTASLFRVVEARRPTLLVDEADTFLRERDELRGVLNSGHTRGSAVVVRTVGDDHEPRTFSTWAPKAIALIGGLPDTLEDRAIVLHMRRRRPDEVVAGIRLDRLRELEPLRRKVARWAADHIEALEGADPDVPTDLHDRAADNWRPLFAIADLVDVAWAERARRAALRCQGMEAVDTEASTLLLADLKDLFDDRPTDKLASSEIVKRLVSMEERPWPEWSRGKPLTATALARLLKPFGVRPKTIRLGVTTPKGYALEDLQDAFDRYLSPAELSSASATPQQASECADDLPSTSRNTREHVAVVESAESAHQTLDVAGVAARESLPENEEHMADLFDGIDGIEGTGP